MKIKIAGCLMLAAVFFTTLIPAAKAGGWGEGAGDYLAAVKHYKETGEPFLLYFYTTWCPVCRRFEQNVFQDETASGYLDGFMKVRIDAEKEEELAYDFNVEAYPTFYVVSKAGAQEMPRFSNPIRFVEECKKAGLK